MSENSTLAVDRYELGPIGTNCYVVRASRTTTEAVVVDPGGDANKLRLRDATDAALARGVFGVPTLGIGDKLFWGFD